MRTISHQDRSPAVPLPDDLELYAQDLAALGRYEERAEDDHNAVAKLPLWRPTEYERCYLPSLRLVGIADKGTTVLQNSADLHMHTEWSDGDRLDSVLEQAMKAGLDAIAITDHDVIEGALEARRRAHERRLPLAVIPGVEISSAEGHIGALFVTRLIPKGLSAEETIRRIHEAGGLAVAHHPYVPRWIEVLLRERLGCRDLIKTLPFDAIECTNAVPGRGIRYNLRAVEEMRRNHIPVAITGSSDAHMAYLVGKGRTYFSGNEGALSLRRGLAGGFTMGAEGYWSTAEKVRYYFHLGRAVFRNLILRRSSIN